MKYFFPLEVGAIIIVVIGIGLSFSVVNDMGRLLDLSDSFGIFYHSNQYVS
jgi:hypothetical protein